VICARGPREKELLAARPYWGLMRLARLINPTRSFKTLPTASATIKGFEVMRIIRKGQCLLLEPGPTEEVRFVNRLFRLAA